MLVLLGASHHSAPVAMRERLAFRREALPDALKRLHSLPGVEEAVIVSTCNRVEIVVRCEPPSRGVADLREFLAEQQGISQKELERYCFGFEGTEAVRHLFRVASGLDSMIIGEPQILGQVKQAYLTARQYRTTGPLLERLMQYGLATAKRVRTETGIARHAVSIAYAAVQLGRKIFGDLAGRRVLLLGAGKMSFLVAKHLGANGVAEIVVASRSYNHAVETAERSGGRAVHWDAGLDMLAEVDIVVSCTDAPRVILTRKQVAVARKLRRGEPLFLIDIAVPRDIDPKVNSLDNVYLYDIDGLQGVIDSNLEERKCAAKEAELMVEREVAGFERWRQTQAVTPTIVALREGLFDMGRRELERYHGKLSTLDPEQQKTVEQLTRSIIQKMLHRPIRHLRGAVERGDLHDCLGLYDHLFELKTNTTDEDRSAGKRTEEDATDGATGSGPTRLLQGGKDK